MIGIGVDIGCIDIAAFIAVAVGGSITISGTPTDARIGTPYSYGFAATGPTQVGTGLSDLTEVGLSYTGATSTIGGTP